MAGRVLLIGPLEDPNPHQVLQHQILDTSPGICGHLLSSPDQVPPELIIGQALRQSIIVPLVDVKLRPILTNLTELHTLCDLRRKCQIHQGDLGLPPTCWLVRYPKVPPPMVFVEWL